MPPSSSHRRGSPDRGVTWVITLAAFGAGLAIGTAGTDSDPQAAKTVTVTSVVERKVFTENCAELNNQTEELICERTTAGRREAATKTTAAPAPAPAAPVLTDGVYEVSAEIKPGTYKTRAEGDDCYWARLADPDSDRILANHAGTGPMTLRVRSTDKFVELSGGCEWRKVG